MAYIYVYISFFLWVPQPRPRPRPVQAMEMKKFSGIVTLENTMNLLRFFILGRGCGCGRGAAAATTRSSDGNEKVFRNFTAGNDLFFVKKQRTTYLFCMLPCFLGAGVAPRSRPRPVQAMEMKKFSGMLPLIKLGAFLNSHPLWIRGSS